MDKNIEYVWKDRKRTIFGLPLSFTVYKLTKEKLLIETGFLSKSEEEVRLYRIMDLTLKRPFWQRLFGVGTIHCCTADKSTPEFDILKIKKPSQVKNMLSDMVEQQRDEKRISAREFMDGDDFDTHDDTN
ncbi:MAG: PH domain-containing protein [Clostridia bacterium]|nr:PH domain-containing protein [Clostridia bacterium]MBQ6905726.1 PH domain-containing protein [Clostridia bacterium]